MGPGYFVIAILGCADGGSACTPVAALPAHYASAEECALATAAALDRSAELDFPTLLAQCREERPAYIAKPAPAKAAADSRKS